MSATLGDHFLLWLFSAKPPLAYWVAGDVVRTRGFCSLKSIMDV